MISSLVAMSNLRYRLDQVAQQFVSSILAAISQASLDELTAGNSVRNGASARSAAPGPTASTVRAPTVKPTVGARRRRRASADEVQKQKDAALAAAKVLKAEFSKGDVMRQSGSKLDLGRALSLLVADGKLTRKGDRRKARYWLR
jgi:hypothetical protein